jgi:hypothetical protein
MNTLYDIAAPSFVARGASPSTIRRAVDRRGLAIFGAATAAALLLGAVMLFAIWARTRVTEAAYRLAAAAQEQQQLLRDREALLIKLSALRSPQRLQEIARRLGMSPAPAERTVVIVDSPAVKSPSATAMAARQ